MLEMHKKFVPHDFNHVRLLREKHNFFKGPFHKYFAYYESSYFVHIILYYTDESSLSPATLNPGGGVLKKVLYGKASPYRPL